MTIARMHDLDLAGVRADLDIQVVFLEEEALRGVPGGEGHDDRIAPSGMDDRGHHSVAEQVHVDALRLRGIGGKMYPDDRQYKRYQ